jgi:cyclase
MKTIELAPDLIVFVGDDLESVAGVVLDGKRALLIDTLCSLQDARLMKSTLADQYGVSVRGIVITHFMDDHLAGLPLFPCVPVIAHQHYMHTYMSQAKRSPIIDQDLVAPTVLFDNALSFRWGAHTLELFHNPGHTVSTIAVDIPDLDAVFVGDTLVGHTAYLSSSAPELIDRALHRIEQLGRGIVIPGHMGPQVAQAPGDARVYLRRLEAAVRSARMRARGDAAATDQAIESIAVEDCLSPGREASSFEREWHGFNLAVIRQRNVFATTKGNTSLRA